MMNCPHPGCEGELLMREEVEEFWSFQINGRYVEREERRRRVVGDSQTFHCEKCLHSWTFDEVRKAAEEQ